MTTLFFFGCVVHKRTTPNTLLHTLTHIFPRCPPHARIIKTNREMQTLLCCYYIQTQNNRLLHVYNLFMRSFSKLEINLFSIAIQLNIQFSLVEYFSYVRYITPSGLFTIHPHSPSIHSIIRFLCYSLPLCAPRFFCRSDNPIFDYTARIKNVY